jgi:hypothetical protein
MKRTLIFTLLFLLLIQTFAQNQKLIQRSWVKTSIENLSANPTDPDTLYTRYTFDKNSLKISFYPGWDSYKQTWAVNDKELVIGYDHYKIETLNDSVLVFSLEGFRRFMFMAEEYLSRQEKYLVPVGEYKGKPLFKANDYITPRYSGKESLRDYIQKNVGGYNIKKASYFLATFIITGEGKVENIKIVKGITEGFDKEIIKQLLKTSKNWRPAYFAGKPIQTEMSYDIKYLDSFVPVNTGSLN